MYAIIKFVIEEVLRLYHVTLVKDYVSLCLLLQGKTRSSFFKLAKSFPMYPCKDEKVKWDDYGEVIR